MMQVSKMLDPERGLSLPWKTPVLPRTKKSSSGLRDISTDRFTCREVPLPLYPKASSRILGYIYMVSNEDLN